MIILYELLQLHVSHAPFTRAFAQSVATAFPDRQIAIYAHSTHLKEAIKDDDPILRGRLIKENTDNIKHSFIDIFKSIYKTYRQYSDQNPIIVFLTSQPKHIWVAKFFARLFPGFRCHLILHGDIHHIQPPYSRNFFRRLEDWIGSMSYANHRNVRYLVLEPHIASSIARWVPGIAAYIDAIHHPCLEAPPAEGDFDPAKKPLRFGIIGIAGRSKGLDVFARLAIRTKAAAGDAVDFRLVGKVQKGWQELDLGGISGPLPFSEEWLSQSVFEDEVQHLHYAMLPYDMKYYAYAASGVLLDALRWRKPLISFKAPPIVELAERFGDIGYLCEDEEEMAATIKALALDFDLERYQTQRRNIEAAYNSRRPIAIADECRHVLRASGPSS